MLRSDYVLRRRDFLCAGTLAGLGAGLPDRGRHCILLSLTGGASQLDTWDMKPEAPSGIRGPFRPIRTNVSGIEISEIFPRMAKHADKFAILRGGFSPAQATHEAAREMLRVGAFREAVFAEAGGNWREPRETRERYGLNRFGQNCLRARRMVEAGERCVRVEMFESVFQQLTWDIHGFPPFSPIGCYRDVVGPMFDMAYTSLLTDLHDRGLLKTTLVVAMGEFGRTPKINCAGGRDHYPECWSALVAGGPIVGGQVIGSSDAMGGAPKDRPVTPDEIAATIRHWLGQPQDPGSKPIRELFV